MITITVKVCGDQWNNPNEVEKLLDENAGQKPVILDLQAEGPSLHSLGISDVIDNYCKKYYIDPADILIKSWSNRAETVKYSLANSHILSHFFGLSSGYWLDQLREPSHEYVIGYFIGRRTVPRSIIMHHLYYKYHADVLLSCLQLNTDFPWKHTPPGISLDLLDDWMPQDCQTNFINWWDSNPIPSLDNHSLHDQYIPNSTTNRDILEYYHRFDIELVAESYTRGISFFPTEKTVRPIMAAKPLIVYGPINYLERLRSLGFKTWNDIWNEHYDLLEGQERWQAIRNLIDLIITMPAVNRIDMLHEAYNIALYNRKHLSDLIKLK